MTKYLLKNKVLGEILKLILGLQIDSKVEFQKPIPIILDQELNLGLGINNDTTKELLSAVRYKTKDYIFVIELLSQVFLLKFLAN